MSANVTLLETAPLRSAAHESDARRTFDTLYRSTYKRAYSLAYRMLGNRSDAEDITQEAYLRAWRHFDQYNRAAPFEAWLFRILINQAYSLLRQRRGRPTCSLTLFDEDATCLQTAGTAGDPQRVVLRGAVDGALQEAMMSLPAASRVVLLLCDVEEQSYQEIAEILRVPLGTVRSRIHRARRQMRRALELIGSSASGRSAA